MVTRLRIISFPCESLGTASSLLGKGLTAVVVDLNSELISSPSRGKSKRSPSGDVEMVNTHGTMGVVVSREDFDTEMRADPFQSVEPASATRRTVFVVEDDPDIRELCVSILHRFGYTVYSADSDCKADWIWGRHRHEIELLVTDLMIPTCSTGLDLARKFKAEKPGLKIAFTSGFGKEIAGDDRALLDESPYLPKPFTAKELMQLVSSSLAVRRDFGGCPTD